MREYKITTDSKKHFESLINDYKKTMRVITLTTTTAILTSDAEQVRIDLI